MHEAPCTLPIRGVDLTLPVFGDNQSKTLECFLHSFSPQTNLCSNLALMLPNCVIVGPLLPPSLIYEMEMSTEPASWCCREDGAVRVEF